MSFPLASIVREHGPGRAGAFISSLPRNPSGKVLENDLREAYAEEVAK